MTAVSSKGKITPGAWGAWCPDCQDGINRTDAGTAADWARTHNAARHSATPANLTTVTVKP